MTLLTFQLIVDKCYRTNCRTCKEIKSPEDYRNCALFKYRALRRGRHMTKKDLTEYLSTNIVEKIERIGTNDIASISDVSGQLFQTQLQKL